MNSKTSTTETGSEPPKAPLTFPLILLTASAIFLLIVFLLKRKRPNKLRTICGYFSSKFDPVRILKFPRARHHLLRPGLLSYPGHHALHCRQHHRSLSANESGHHDYAPLGSPSDSPSQYSDSDYEYDRMPDSSTTSLDEPDDSDEGYYDEEDYEEDDEEYYEEDSDEDSWDEQAQRDRLNAISWASLAYHMYMIEQQELRVQRELEASRIAGNVTNGDEDNNPGNDVSDNNNDNETNDTSDKV